MADLTAPKQEATVATARRKVRAIYSRCMSLNALLTNVFVLLDVGVDPQVVARPRAGRTPALTFDDSADGTMGETRLRRLLTEGSSWIFYGDRYRDERRRVQLSESASGRVADSGTNTECEARLVFVRDYESTAVGHSRPGVITLWLFSDVRDQDPLVLKRRAADDQRRLAALVESLGCRWESVGRIFVFVASHVESRDLDLFVTENATDVATLFTGGLEDEAGELLRAHLKANLSARRYERLYLRWTDGLALYDNSDRGKQDRELATMRALRVVETSLLMRRLLRDVSYDLDELSPSVSALSIPFLARPWKQNERIRRSISQAQLTTMVAPPVHSVEGEELLTRAFASCGIPELLGHVEKLQAELQRRLDWTKVLWLAAWGGIAFATPFVVDIIVRSG